MTVAEQPFFMVIQHHKNITQEELTSIVCVDKAATTRALKSLEKKGFLVRVKDKNDRRQNRICATEKAQNLFKEVNEELIHFNELLTKNISLEEIDIVYKGLEEMEKNISKKS
nr:MarR family transcriptional regulator [uncultured Fusobacterium sp.]